jgi:hypothetical protein
LYLFQVLQDLLGFSGFCYFWQNSSKDLIFNYLSSACGRFSDSLLLLIIYQNSEFFSLFWGEFTVFFLANCLLISIQNNRYSVPASLFHHIVFISRFQCYCKLLRIYLNPSFEWLVNIGHCIQWLKLSMALFGKLFSIAGQLRTIHWMAPFHPPFGKIRIWLQMKAL